MKFYSRVLRSSLMDSEAYCRLPSDTHRLIFASLLWFADDYGNFEDNRFALKHHLTGCTSLKSEEDLALILEKLIDAGFLFYYQYTGKNKAFKGKAYFHIMKFRSDRTYWARHYPMSPCEDEDSRKSDCERKRGWPRGGEVDPTLREKKDTFEQKQVLAPISETEQKQIEDKSKMFPGQGEGVGVLKPLYAAQDAAKEKVANGEGEAVRGTRLPKDWTCTEELIEVALGIARDRDFPITRGQALRIGEQFRDYWHAKAGRDAVKLDWAATWRNWIRNANLTRASLGGASNGITEAFMGKAV